MPNNAAKKTLTPELAEELLEILQERFEKNMHRHPDLKWEKVRDRLDAHPGKLWVLQEMERTGGQPDVVGSDSEPGGLLYCDCSPESPSGRRSLCYDGPALESRKANKPAGSAVDTATAMGVELLTEDQYRALQAVGPFDTKTSSWLRTPDEVRKLGGAIFGDFRFGRVFVYHNGAESYYAARGFRAVLRL